MNKKTMSLVGMIVALAMVLFGILAMAGALGGNTSWASGSYLYDSGYASFGADFYTYVSNNAAEAASATRTVAGNLGDIADLLKNVCGLFLIGFGAMAFCFFGSSFSEAKAACAAAAAETIPCEPKTEVEAPAEEPAVEISAE